MELPQVQSCNCCGECCRRGGDCVIRPWARLPEKFQGRCEILTDNPDGTTSCRLIAAAKNSNNYARMWADIYIRGECTFPELRKEICATV